MQNGQPVATVLAPVCFNSRYRFVLTRSVPFSSSFQNCPPPAPQQKLLLRSALAQLTERPWTGWGAGLIEDTIMAAQMRDRDRSRTIGVGSELDPAVSNELVDKFRVVPHHIATAKLGVFIANGVKAVRTSRDDNFGLRRPKPRRFLSPFGRRDTRCLCDAPGHRCTFFFAQDRPV